MSLMDQQWCPTSAQVTVLQARGLRIKGKSGTNDAYAVMQVGKEKYQTSVVEKSVAPVWKEEAAFDLPQLQQGGGGGADRSTLHVHVLHRALVGPDKLLGQAVINLLQLSEDKTRNKTEWFKLLDKTGKPDKDRGEVLVDIQFMRNNMTASMFDLSAAGKSRSRLGKFKDKVRGKKKESDAASTLVPSFTQVLTDSEEEKDGEAEAAAGKDEKKKKNKMKSLFSPKSNLQKNMSQSMSVLPGKNSSLSGSQSSGLNVDPSEGKKKFKFKIHKRSGSSDSKDSSSGYQKHSAAEQSNLCINGSHVYCEEPPPRNSRIGSNFSLASSGHGSMEDVPESSPPSVDSSRGVRQYSPWTEEEEEMAEAENLKEEVGEPEEEEDKMRRQEEEAERLAEEKRRQERMRVEEEKRQREEEERIKMEKERAQEVRRIQEEEERKLEEEKRRLEEEERRTEEERARKEEEERVRREKEERERLAEEKRRLEEQERRRIEEEEKRQREEEERVRMEEERAQEERRRQEEEERVRLEEQRAQEERRRREEEERVRLEEERAQAERMRQEKEERARRQEEELERLAEEKRRLEEEERRRSEEEQKRQWEEEERVQMEEERAQEERKRYEEECKLAEEKRRLEEEERQRIEKETARKAEEERIRREEEDRVQEERRRQEEEELMRRQEEEREQKRRLEEQERRQREEEEMLRREEEEKEKARKEKEEYERLLEEKRKQEEEERKRIETEEKIRKEEEERMRLEEERRRQEEEREKLAEEKRIREEQERKRIEEEEKRQREEEEKIRKEEERRREEEERARKEKEEYERLLEEQMRQEQERKRVEDEERRRQEEQERIRMEKERRMRQEEEEKSKKEEEERMRREKKAEEERKEEEVRKLEKVMKNAEEQKKRENKMKRKAPEMKSKVESPSGVTSTNPFDENFSNNPFEETAGPDSSKVSAVQQRNQSAVSSLGNKTASNDEKDLISAQREKRAAPQPPGRNQAEKQSQREQDGSAQHLAQINKKSKDKDVKTVTVPPQRSVRMIAPLSRSPAGVTNTHSLTQSSSAKGTTNVAKHSKRPAPSRPRSSESKTASSSAPVVCGLNPFEDDEDEDVQGDMTTNAGSVQWPPAVSQAADKDATSRAKIKSSKTAQAPPLPEKKAPTSSTSADQNTEVDVTDHKDVTIPENSMSPSPGQHSLHVQETPLQESKPATLQSGGEGAGVKKEGPPTASRRLQPVKPLNPLEQQTVSVVQEEIDNKSTGTHSDSQEKTKVNDSGLKGPYSQLTREELISLLRKQENQLSDRDKKISELEQYIDNLLVRVMEEKPSILLSMNSMKKSA